MVDLGLFIEFIGNLSLEPTFNLLKFTYRDNEKKKKDAVSPLFIFIFFSFLLIYLFIYLFIGKVHVEDEEMHPKWLFGCCG